jgi:hypothetical protein
VEIIHECSRCNWPERIEDEGQHLTVTVCIKCNYSEEVRHRPDPEPLPPEQERLRFETIRKVFDAFVNATLHARSQQDREWLSRVHYSALDTVNFLCDYQARKTIMTGGRKK